MMWSIIGCTYPLMRKGGDGGGRVLLMPAVLMTGAVKTAGIQLGEEVDL